MDLNNNQIYDNTSESMIYKHGDLPSSIAVAGAGTSTLPFGGANYVVFDGTGYPRTTAGAQLSGGIVLTDRTGSSTNVRTLCLANFGRPRIVTAIDACTSG